MVVNPLYIWGYERFTSEGMSRFHCIHGFAKTQFRDDPVGTSPGIIGLFTIFRTILVESQSLQLETCGFCWDLWGDAICRFSLFWIDGNKGESFSWGRTHRSQCVLTGDYRRVDGKMSKLILDLMLEAANHRWIKTRRTNNLFDKFQWSS